MYLQPYLNTQEGKYACILNYGLIVGTFHFLFNNSLVMFLSDTYCHHVPTTQFKSSTAWPEHRPRPGSAAGSPEAELEARRRLDKEAALTSLSLQEQQGGGAGGRLLVALLDAVPLLRGAGDNIIYI